MFDHLLESSHGDDSNKWSNIGFGQEIKELASIEIHFTRLIWRSGLQELPNVVTFIVPLSRAWSFDCFFAHSFSPMYLEQMQIDLFKI